MRPVKTLNAGRALSLLCLFALAVGCGQKAVVAPPLAIEAVPAKMEDAFQSAQPEVTTAVQEAVASVRGDDPAALQQLQELSTRSELTPEQRATANQSLFAVLARLQAAETNGNSKAAEALQQYRASK